MSSRRRRRSRARSTILTNSPVQHEQGAGGHDRAGPQDPQQRGRVRMRSWAGQRREASADAPLVAPPGHHRRRHKTYRYRGEMDDGNTVPGTDDIERDAELEGALAAAEAEIEAAARSVGSLSRELKRARAAAVVGQVRELRRALDAAADQARAVADQVAAGAASYDVDEGELLRSGAYTKELLAAAEGAGVSMHEDDDRLLCYPSIVRVLPGDQALEVDRKRAPRNSSVGGRRPARPRPAGRSPVQARPVPRQPGLRL